ncbi:ATP-binding protein, partial [Georgenia sp. 10Sc9-8]|nr:ATP-binding protein [Georgenia halotolerans]
SVQNQGPRAAAAQVSVAVLAPEHLPVRGDPAQLLQVVDNLLTNAIKYSRPGGRVVVELGAQDGTVSMCVRDEGIGISEPDQEKLFTRFFRADAVRRGPVQGTGLGLHISRQIVEAHGGGVAVASELGHGTAVTVTLPTATQEDA